MSTALFALPQLIATPTHAQTKVSIKGRIKGGQYLMNPVWNEAKNPANHRYTFRARSPTVSERAKKLRAYLPKELCLVALKTKGTAAPSGKPYQIGISGGRTTPVTLVIPVGQNVQFVNHDPFPHKLYDVGKVANGLGPEATKPSGQRIWKPPKQGVYEIRDMFFPSVRSWIVVEPRAAAVGFVNFKGEYVIAGLSAGEYEIQGYFSGKKTGKSIKVTVRTAPEVQTINNVLVVATKNSKKKGK